MSNLENLLQILRNMNNEIAELNKNINIKKNRISEISNRIEELTLSLMEEKNDLDLLNQKKDKVTELQSVAESNFKQINESVNTLLDILKTGN
jgi:hypothetical protein